MAGGQAGGGDLKPLRHSYWSPRRKGAWPLLTMRCKDPTTFQSPGPRPWATPRSLGRRLPVPSATPPSQLLKRPLQRFVSLFGARVSVFLSGVGRGLNGSAVGNLGKWRRQTWVRVYFGISCLEHSALCKTTADESGKESIGDGTRTLELTSGPGDLHTKMTPYVSEGHLRWPKIRHPILLAQIPATIS